MKTITKIRISKLIKRSLITSIVSVALCPAIAQPTFTSLDVPKADPSDIITEYIFNRNGLLNAGADIKGGLSGPNRTWNYSMLLLNNPNPSKIVYGAPATTTPYSSSFPTANLAYKNILSIGTLFYYIKSTSTALTEVGYRSSLGQNPVFSNKTLMKFPFTMNSTFSDVIHLRVGSTPTRFHEYKTIKADAYGTLILPDQTYTNVLRVRTVTMHRDTTPFGIGNQIDTIYAWYANGDALTPLFKITKSVGNAFDGQPVNYLDAVVYKRVLKTPTLWPGGIIPYVTDVLPTSSFFSKVTKVAMDSISKKYNVCFVPRAYQPNYLSINIAHLYIYDPAYSSIYNSYTSSGDYGRAGGKQDVKACIVFQTSPLPYQYAQTSVNAVYYTLLRNAGIIEGVTKRPKELYYGPCSNSRKQDEEATIEEQTMDQTVGVNLYPNPTSGTISIKINLTEVPEGIKYTIRNTMSQVVMQSNLQTETQIDLSHLNNGIYFFETLINEERIIEKIVKQ